MNRTLLNSNNFYSFSVAFYFGYAYVAMEKLKSEF